MQYKLYMTFPELLKRETDKHNMTMAIIILNSKQIPGHIVCGCWVLQAIHSEIFPHCTVVYNQVIDNAM